MSIEYNRDNNTYTYNFNDDGLLKKIVVPPGIGFQAVNNNKKPLTEWLKTQTINSAAKILVDMKNKGGRNKSKRWKSRKRRSRKNKTRK